MVTVRCHDRIPQTWTWEASIWDHHESAGPPARGAQDQRQGARRSA